MKRASIIISLILWNRGDKSSKYLFFTFLIPFAGALIYFIVDALISRTTSIEEPNFRLGIILKSLPAFFSLFMPVTLGLALAQRLNDFKKEVLDKQIELNEHLEQKTEGWSHKDYDERKALGYKCVSDYWEESKLDQIERELRSFILDPSPLERDGKENGKSEGKRIVKKYPKK